MSMNLLCEAEFVKERNGAREFRLTTNGLRVLLVPNKLGRVIAIMTHYNIGSRNEAPGYTGSAHFLEHLMFKGSKNFSRDEFGLDKMMTKTGAYVNANTWYDRTGYLEICLPEHLDLFIAFEADRMRNAIFSDKDRQDEMTVVRGELEITENDPSQLLRMLVTSTAVQQHPYHWDTIGYRADVENVLTERFREFYDTFYYPNNAMIIIIGNLDEENALNMAVKHFGNIRSSPKPIPEIYTQEPVQKGERRVILRRPGGNGIIQLAWIVPGATHPDFAALEVLNYVLSVGNRGFLKTKFVDSGRVADVGSVHFELKDAYPFFIEIYLLRQRGHAGVEREILKYLESLKGGVLSHEALERAKLLAEAKEWYGRDNLESMLNAFSDSEGAGGWELYYSIPDAMHKVSLYDVMHVLRKYFTPDNLTVGWYVPKKALSDNISEDE